MNEYLTKNFGYSEACVSASYPKLADKIVLTKADKINIKCIAIFIMQPIRDKFGRLDIESWKRDCRLNKKVGGVSNSDHRYGCAVDFVPYNFNSFGVFKWIVNESGLKYKEVIFYPQSENEFIHISMNNIYNNEECQQWIKYKGKYISIEEYENT